METNLQALAKTAYDAKLNTKLSRAANAKHGRSVLISVEDAEAIYNLPKFFPDADKLAGWVMVPRKTGGESQVAMGRRSNGQMVLFPI